MNALSYVLYRIVFVCVSLYTINAWAQIADLEIPAQKPDDQIIKHAGYVLCYSEEHEQPAWVAWELTKEELEGYVIPKSNFRVDPAVTTGSAAPDDYKQTGYHKGHLAPARDMVWSNDAMNDSYYMSNMSPMLPGYNIGIWKNLETKVREWATESNAVYVVAGPLLKDGLPTIGVANQVSIPEDFYKIVLDYREPDSKAIAFIIKHEPSPGPLGIFAVTIDSVEAVTGIDFFPKLPDSLEHVLEGSYNTQHWGIEPAKEVPAPPYVSVNQEDSITIPTQCKGITRRGRQCRRKTKNESGYCYFHRKQVDPALRPPLAVQCRGLTRKGEQCKRKTKHESGYCFFHRSQANGDSE